MNLKMMNEAFKRQYSHCLNESLDESDKTRLKKALVSRSMNVIANGGTIKNLEIALQEVIEDMFPDHCWWEVTDCQIFNELLAGTKPREVCDMIVDKIKPEFRNVVEDKCSDELNESSVEYAKWVQLPDGKWKMWGSNEGPDLDPEFLDRARKQNKIDYKDAKVSKNGEYPDGVSEEDVQDIHRLGKESVKEGIKPSHKDALKDKVWFCYSREDLEEQGADLSKLSDKDINRILNKGATDEDIEKMFGGYSFVDDDFGVDSSLEETVSNPDKTISKVDKNLGKAVDKDMVRDLTLIIENDGDVYRRFTTPVIANLKKKLAKGNFDEKLAVQAFVHVVENALRQPYFYRYYSYDIKSVPVAVRYAVAKELLDGSMDEIEYRDIKESVGARGSRVPNKVILFRLKECLRRLRESSISPEDKADSDLIRSMIAKLQNRSNARFSPEEKAVMDKYGITRNNWTKKLEVGDRELNPNYDGKTRRKHWRSSSDVWHNGDPNKINYADRARKLPQRADSQVANSWTPNGEINAHARVGGSTLQSTERSIIADRDREPVEKMKRHLWNRKYHQGQIDGAQDEYDKSVNAARADYDKRMKVATDTYRRHTVDAEKRRNNAQSNIDAMLKRK